MRELRVFGPKNFKITIPDEAKVTFGPWSPPTEGAKYQDRSDRALAGTLRVYETAKQGASVLAVFSGVTSFRDSVIDYQEEVAREEGAILWKSDHEGYRREEKVKRHTSFLSDGENEEGGDDGDTA